MCDKCDQLQVQLAGCSVAALGGISTEQLAVMGDYGWSPAYQDVVELRKKYEIDIRRIESMATYPDGKE